VASAIRPLTRGPYATDASHDQIMPIGVVAPSSTKEVEYTASVPIQKFGFRPESARLEQRAIAEARRAAESIARAEVQRMLRKAMVP
jgi:hypothetical protein